MKNKVIKRPAVKVSLAFLFLGVLSLAVLLGLQNAAMDAAEASVATASVQSPNVYIQDHDTCKTCPACTGHGPGREDGFNGNASDFLNTGCRNYKRVV